jgi:GNAT superfamily N-acetyltransferase
MWRKSPKGWIRGGEESAHIVLRPVTESVRLREASSPLPDSHPVYVLGALWVDPERRGQGLGRDLLYRGARHLLRREGGSVWLGLMTDNFRLPPGRTRSDIRAVWDAFVAEHPGATMQSGFILLTSEMDLGG